MQLTFMTVKIERVEKVNDKHASCPNSSAQHTDQGQILLLQDKTNVNLILPAEAASMPSSKWVLFMGVTGCLLAWDPNTVVHHRTTGPDTAVDSAHCNTAAAAAQHQNLHKIQ